MQTSSDIYSPLSYKKPLIINNFFSGKRETFQRGFKLLILTISHWLEGEEIKSWAAFLLSAASHNAVLFLFRSPLVHSTEDGTILRVRAGGLGFGKPTGVPRGAPGWVCLTELSDGLAPPDRNNL